MKKLIAILLSALMLCTLMSFATVSAEDLITIEIATVESANAGDEIEVSVNLNDIPEGKGLLGCQVEILFDSNVFELVTYFDEDEEMYMPQIEVNSKYSDKFIMFAPVDDDGFSERCLVQYLRATAKESQLRYEADFYTATFKVKDNAPSGTYTLTLRVDQGEPMTLNNVKVPYTLKNAEIIIEGVEPACEHEYANDCSKVCSKCGEETRPEADHDYAETDRQDATCGADGYVTYTCSKCAGSYTGTITATGEHTYFDACSPICEVCGAEREVSHNKIHVEAVPATCTTDGNIEYWYCDKCGAAWLDEACTLNTNQKAVIQPASCSYNAIHNEGIPAGCHYTGRVENWYCATCDVYYLDAACARITNYKSLTIPALKDSADYVAAKEPTCTENGNVAYWYCAECEQVWADEALTQLSNIQNVQIAPSCKYNAVYTEAKAATCFEPGNVAYWYCANCDVYYSDAECTIITNAKNVVLPIVHTEVYVAAKAPTCTEDGNIEHWYCEDCGQAWLDELHIFNTNLKAVILPATGHSYTNAHDVDCDVCGAVRDLVLPAEDVILDSGNSISELKNGLAYKFDVAAKDVVIGEDYIADYSNAKVAINGVDYKLITMGVVTNNKGLADQTLENVDGKNILNVEAKKAFELDGVLSYAVRVINIPADKLDVEIIVRSYFIYENAEGEQITVYGEDWQTSYNAEISVG